MSAANLPPAGSRSRAAVALLPIAVAVGLIGCRRPATPAPGPARPPVLSAPVTEADADAFAVAFEDAIDSGDPSQLDPIVDWARIEAAATTNPGASAPVREAFVRGLRDLRAGGKGVLGEVIKSSRDGGSYTLIRSHQRDGRRRLLFRFLQPDWSIDYHDLILERGDDGLVRVADIFLYGEGITTTERIRRGFELAVADILRKEGAVPGNNGPAGDSLLEILRKMRLAAEAGEFGEVLRIDRTSPPEVRADRHVLLHRVAAAREREDFAEVHAAVEEFRARFPGAWMTEILSMEDYLREKQFDLALGCVDRIGPTVFDDPYLETLRASIHLEQGNLAAARDDVRRALEADPNLDAAYLRQLDIDLRTKDHPATVATLRLLRDRFGYEFDGANDPDYADFAKSPEYAAFLKDTPPPGNDPDPNPAPPDAPKP